jgi:hypothetical protein
MDGRAFLESARLLMTTPTEANRRSAVGRAYYAVLNEARVALERWGFSAPAGADIDDYILSRFDRVLNMDILRVADALDQLGEHREVADYSLSTPGVFADEKGVNHLLQRAEIGIDLLDQIEADPARRAKAVADIRAAFPCRSWRGRVETSWRTTG